MNGSYDVFIGADETERADAFISAGSQGRRTRPENIEKDFWVCYTLDVLFNGRPPDAKRLLFKGGTSLSKGFDLISRFSEDVDVTVFREDLGHGISADEMSELSGKKRGNQLDEIKADCGRYVTETMLRDVRARLDETFERARIGRDRWSLTVDAGDPDGQSLLFAYPTALPAGDDYVRRVVKIESGAKSAVEPAVATTVTPYVSAVVPDLDLSVPGVVTADPKRTFWDKVIIAHGQRQWYEDRGELKGGGLRVTRHYYDLHMMLASAMAQEAMADDALRDDVVLHARMFFDRRPFALALAAEGRFTLVPAPGALPDLRRDYAGMTGMIFGDPPSFDDVMRSVSEIEERVAYASAPRP